MNSADPKRSGEKRPISIVNPANNGFFSDNEEASDQASKRQKADSKDENNNNYKM